MWRTGVAVPVAERADGASRKVEETTAPMVVAAEKSATTAYRALRQHCLSSLLSWGRQRAIRQLELPQSLGQQSAALCRRLTPIALPQQWADWTHSQAPLEMAVEIKGAAPYCWLAGEHAFSACLQCSSQGAWSATNKSLSTALMQKRQKHSIDVSVLYLERVKMLYSYLRVAQEHVKQ